MRIQDICSHRVAIIGKYDSIYSAARLMRDRKVNHVVVVESLGGDNTPVGILTDREIVVNLIAEEVDLRTIAIGDIINKKQLTANGEDDVLATIKRMRHKGIRLIPVISKEKGLIGVLSIEDVLSTLTEQLNDIDQIISREQRENLWPVNNTISPTTTNYK